MKKICEQCKNEFNTTEIREGRARYCSMSCSSIAQKRQTEKKCEVCGRNFQVRQYRKDTARFCSKECGGKWHMQNRIMRGPSLIGNKFRQGLRPSNAFTPEQVRGENSPAWVETIQFFCVQCGCKFLKKPWQTKSQGFSGKFCSAKCRNTHRKELESGENSPYWVGGSKTYRGRGWKETRKIIVDRQNGTCAKCGKHVGKSLTIHHKEPFRKFLIPEAANHPDNLIGLCQSCHMKEEKSFIIEREKR